MYATQSGSEPGVDLAPPTSWSTLGSLRYQSWRAIGGTVIPADEGAGFELIFLATDSINSAIVPHSVKVVGNIAVKKSDVGSGFSGVRGACWLPAMVAGRNFARRGGFD
jgi:hypothetical protein